MDFAGGDGGSPSDIPTRPMRVKVLYSFDKDNKDNCLARFPHTLHIPAVSIDETSQVGVIELRPCIHAIVSASPELVSRLTDGDFTIYAYDYSEYDTPLVGQGTLSAALAAAGAAPSPPPAGADKAMITGRVCQNIPALFSNGVKETLEVKLRLVPIPKPASHEFAKGVEGVPGGISPATSAGFDPNAWNASLQQGRPAAPAPSNDYFGFTTDSTASEKDLALMDEMLCLDSGSSGSGSGQPMLGGVGIAETPTDPTFGFNPAFSHSAPGSRVGSPMMGAESNTHPERLRHQSFSADTPDFADHSRPGSRASTRSEVHSSHHRRQDSAQLTTRPAHSPTEAYYNEEGQPRKRARVMQTDWRGRSSFGAKSGDLRVTAATTHSMQMHRPVAKRPAAPGADLEPPPRAPTPVPPRVNPRLMPQRPTQSRSLLRQASTVSMNSDVMSDFDQYSDAIMSSPEDASPNNSITAEGTPQDIPSSPPVFAGISAAEPSSPGLPSLPPQRVADSGYMSEPVYKSGRVPDDLDDDENRSPDPQDLEVAAQYRAASRQPHPFIKTERSDSGMQPPYPSDAPPSEINVELETPGDMTQLPHKMLLNLPPERHRERSQGPKPPRPSTSRMSVKGETSLATPANDGQTPGPEPQHARQSSLALPPATQPSARGPARSQEPPSKPASRRQSTKRPRADFDGSEAGSPAPSDTESRPRGTKRSGSGGQRRFIIQQRLEASIAKGDMPQYCSHCGAIETPTWRKLYVKYVSGKPTPLDEAEGEGETIGVEPIDRDQETGEITRFVIRKSMKRTKDFTPGKGFEDITLCNPCGLWFNKFRNMRPSDKWHRKTTSRRSKKQRDGDGNESMMTDGVDPPSDAFFTDQVGPEDNADGKESSEEVQSDETSGAPPAQRVAVTRPRASSMQPSRRRRSGDSALNASQLDVALSRAVQSSPVRSHGSEGSPIEIEDTTPKPTRRLLFPSPRREGEVKSLDDNGQASLHATPRSGKASFQKPSSSEKAGFTGHNGDVNVFEACTFDKENMAPGMEIDDNFARLFEGSPSHIFKTPRKTPSKEYGMTPRSQRQLDHLLKTPTPQSRKRQPLSPNADAANNAMANDFMTSPSSSRYFLRSTPSRQERTPGRGSQHSAPGRGHDMTPFSRHLAQMLSDVNDSAVFTSPTRGFDFSDLPTFSTPGRHFNDMDWNMSGDILSSEFTAFDEGHKGTAGAGEQQTAEADGTEM